MELSPERLAATVVGVASPGLGEGLGLLLLLLKLLALARWPTGVLGLAWGGGRASALASSSALSLRFSARMR